MILAGDIGGTKTRLALFEEKGSELRVHAEEVYRSRDHASLEEIIERFRAEHREADVEAACFGVAGPVIEGRARTTNLPWELEEESLARASGAPHAKLLNDLEAAAYGMLVLTPEERFVLHPGAGRRRSGNIAVIAAGTGLGEAMLIWDGRRHLPVATEGGHADFAPRNELEIELLRFLQKELGRVSAERVVSGPGLHGIYRFLRSRSRTPEPEWLSQRLRADDPSAAISQVALEGKDPVCGEALDLFATLYGAEAGNMALRCLAVGGVFVGGGIAPKILPALRRGSFVEAFRDKGRFAELLDGIEVTVALNPRAPLLGAAHYAKDL